MRHRISGRKLGRAADHRLAMLRNLLIAVLRYERVKTTEAKAKEVRGQVDKIITLAKKGDLHSRRQILKLVSEPEVLEKIYADLVPKYAERTSGFTRLTKLGPRLGDAAPLVQIELVE